MKILTARNRLVEGTRTFYGATLNLDKLFPTSRIRSPGYEDDYEAIKKHIQKKGLMYPLVVWSTTVDQWTKFSNFNTELIGPPIGLLRNKEMPVFLVMCGNNRLEIAKELGYTHIDCIVCSKEGDYSTQCTKQRKNWIWEQQKQQTQSPPSEESLYTERL